MFKKSLTVTGPATRVVLGLLLAFGALITVTRQAYAAPGASAICTWQGNRQAAYSFTVDDCPFSNAGNVAQVLPITIPLAIPMTWYVVTSFMFDPLEPHNPWDAAWDADWVTALVEAGHELGSHTVTHPDNPTVTPTDEEIRAQLRDSKAEIEQLCPENGKCLTIAYSSSWNNLTIRTMAAEYYISGRGVNGPYNPKDPSLDPAAGSGSMFQLCKGTLDPLAPCIADSGWFTDYTHGISDGSQWDMPIATFTARMNEVHDKRDILWAATQRDITQYIYEREASTVQVVSADPARIVLDLFHGLDTTVCGFTYPLTLKTEVYPDWDNITVVQAQDTAVVTAAAEAGTRYAVFDARPNQGQITLSAGGTTPLAYGPVAGRGMPGPEIEPAVLPNPLDPARVSRLMGTGKNVTIYDVTGKPFHPSLKVAEGIYFVRQGQNRNMQKVTILK